MNTTDRNQLSELEWAKIDSEIKEELVDHWYKAASTGVIAAFLGASTFFALFYHRTNLILLTIWFIGLSIVLLGIATLNFAYKRHKGKFTIKQWNLVLSCLVVATTFFWGSTILFNPEDTAQQFVLFILLFIAAASFSLITVGMFVLSVFCVCFILLPVTAWFFSNHTFYYDIGGFSVIIYIIFLSGMNYRSTKWLIHSLQLSKMTRILATHDPLTGLANRSLLYQAFEASLSKSNDLSKKISILFLDLDFFKKINDTLGHEVGDGVLLDFSKKIKSCLSDNDLAARLGGDEFIVMLEDSQLNSTISVAENILKTLTKPIKVETHEIHIGASIGISLYPKDGNSIQELIKKADLALYQAKKTGKAKYQFHTDHPT